MCAESVVTSNRSNNRCPCPWPWSSSVIIKCFLHSVYWISGNAKQEHQPLSSPLAVKPIWTADIGWWATLVFAILVFAMVTATYLFISAVCVTVCWLYVSGAACWVLCVCVTVCWLYVSGATCWVLCVCDCVLVVCIRCCVLGVVCV